MSPEGLEMRVTPPLQRPLAPGHRVADWRVGDPSDSRHWAILRRNAKRTPWYAWPEILGVSVVAVCFALGSAGLSLVAYAFCWVYVFRVLLRTRADRAIAVLSEFDAPVVQYPVDLVLYRLDACYGADSGVMTFCDGWMLFEGESTTFSLSRTDVIIRPPLLERGSGPDPRYLNWMDFFVDGQTFRLGIHPLSRLTSVDGIRQDDLDEGFAWALRKWSFDSFRPEGESVSPPVRPHPSGWYRVWVRQMFARGLIAVGVVAMVITALLERDLLGNLWEIAIVGLPAALGLYLGSKAQKQRWVLMNLEAYPLPSAPGP